MRWKFIQGKIEWEMISIFAGGLAAGTQMSALGAVDAFGTAVSHSGLKGGILLILAIITVTLLFSDVTSNTATAAVAMPSVISIVQGGRQSNSLYLYSVDWSESFLYASNINQAIPVG